MFNMLPESERAKYGPHNWVQSTLGHGETMCLHCKATNREIAVIGDPNHCEKNPRAVAVDMASGRDETHFVLSPIDGKTLVVDISGLFDDNGLADKIKDVIVAHEPVPHRAIVALIANVVSIAKVNGITLDAICTEVYALDDIVAGPDDAEPAPEPTPAEPESNVIRLFPER